MGTVAVRDPLFARGLKVLVYFEVDLVAQRTDEKIPRIRILLLAAPPAPKAQIRATAHRFRIAKTGAIASSDRSNGVFQVAVLLSSGSGVLKEVLHHPGLLADA